MYAMGSLHMTRGQICIERDLSISRRLSYKMSMSSLIMWNLLLVCCLSACSVAATQSYRTGRKLHATILHFYYIIKYAMIKLCVNRFNKSGHE